MRFENYLNEDNLLKLNDIIQLLELNEANADGAIESIKNMAHKLGLRIEKTNSLWSYLKKASKGINDLARHAAIYLSTDVRNTKLKKEITQDAIATLKGIDRQDLMGFLFMLDKISLHMTTNIRHIIQAVFGVEITSYDKWSDDLIYIKDQLKKIREVLHKAGGSKTEFKALNRFENRITEFENKMNKDS